jgi:hypothetical protein
MGGAANAAAGTNADGAAKEGERVVSDGAREEAPETPAAETVPLIGAPRPEISATCAHAAPPGDSRIRESAIPRAMLERKVFMRLL